VTDGRPIVVGFDGSEGSVAAAEWAAREASRRQARLRIVHATVPTHLPVMRSTAVTATTKWKEEAEQTAARGVEAARRSDPSLAVESKVYLNQTAAAALAGEAESATLLVVGARGGGGFAGLRLGSTAVQVIEVVSGPVVIVRGAAAGTSSGLAGARTVVGVDGSEPSHRALRFAFGEATAHGTELIAVHAYSEPWHPALRSFQAPDGVDWSFLRSHAAAVLAESVATAAEEFPGVRVTERLVDGQPSDVLLEASGDAELLVVGSRGASSLRGRILGSVSHTVIHHADCPVAVVR
jgi:nucleotide-binding universal stress UspA family protein